jgi:hypothetical protein
VIPTEIAEWCLISAKYKMEGLYTRKDFEDFTAHLPEPTIEELISFYKMASLPDAKSRLEKWLESVKSVPQTREEQLVRNVVAVFRYLGRRHYDPFRWYAFDNLPDPDLDWSKLPAGFAFLAEPAESFRNYVFDEDLERLTREITPEQRELLEKIAVQIQVEGVEGLITWYKALGLWEHIEAGNVRNLLRVLDELGIRYWK